MNKNKRIKISNEQLLKLLPKECLWIASLTGHNFVKIPLKNLLEANILFDYLVFEIYQEDDEIFLEFCSSFYDLED